MFELKNISKSYGSYCALKDVNITIHTGEIHGLAGVNGSGKSTLLNILSGQAIIGKTGGFSGEILFKDNSLEKKTVTFLSPKDAISLGIGMVHQEFALLSTLTVAENITLTREKTIPFTAKLLGRSFACIDQRADIATATSVLNSIATHKPGEARSDGEVGQPFMDIHAGTITGDLSVGMRQFVEIAREMSRSDLTLLLLDEPTAVLNKAEAEQLMGAVRQIAARGTSILYVSHRIEELISLCDRITVLKGGEVAGGVEKSDLTGNITHDIKKISRLMVGGSVIKTRRAAVNRATGTPPDKGGSLTGSLSTPAITTCNFTVDKPGDPLKGLDLTIFKGEIIGITALSGHGRNALGAGIMGLHPTGGQLTLCGEKITLSDSETRSKKMIEKNIWLVPEDRRTHGLLMDHSIAENITFAAVQNKKMFVKKSSLPFMEKFIQKIISNSGFEFLSAFITSPDNRACKNHALSCVKELDIQCSSLLQKTGELSGGNQQKVCIAAALTMEPDILFVSEPTRGIDIAGKEAILNMLVKAHQKLGMTIIISSGELDELRRICDRIAVIYQGRLFDIFPPDTGEEEFALAFSGLR